MANYLEVSKLLELELPAKKAAMGRYDEILMKIRSGYLVVLGGALGFFVTEKSPLTLNSSMLIVVFWFSAAAWIIDVVFRRRQLRVVKAYNRLVTAAIRNIPEDEGLQNISLELFHISGENLKDASEKTSETDSETTTDTKSKDDISILQCMNPSAYIYPSPALLSALLYWSDNPLRGCLL